VSVQNYDVMAKKLNGWVLAGHGVDLEEADAASRVFS
jgi:hypothetical protein